MTKKQDLKERIDRLEKTVSKLVEVIEDLSTKEGGYPLETQKIGTFFGGGLGGDLDRAINSGANPWTIATVERLSGAMHAMDERIAKANFQTYLPTIQALKGQKGGLTAKDVGDITGKSRNAESEYLNRLYRAGIIDREKEGRKVMFSFRKDSETILRRLFGNF